MQVPVCSLQHELSYCFLYLPLCAAKPTVGGTEVWAEHRVSSVSEMPCIDLVTQQSRYMDRRNGLGRALLERAELKVPVSGKTEAQEPMGPVLSQGACTMGRVGGLSRSHL